MLEMFYIEIVVVIKQLNAFVKSHQIVDLEKWILLYIIPW